MKRFIVAVDDTVTDSTTGLMWQRQDDGIRKTWQKSTAYAKNLTLGGYNDWRLPTLNELFSIVDYNNYNPAIDATAFPNTHSYNYWSSTTYANDPSYAWRVNFSNGYVSNYYKTDYLYVRCVRDQER